MSINSFRVFDTSKKNVTDKAQPVYNRFSFAAFKPKTEKESSLFFRKKQISAY